MTLLHLHQYVMSYFFAWNHISLEMQTWAVACRAMSSHAKWLECGSTLSYSKLRNPLFKSQEANDVKMMGFPAVFPVSQVVAFNWTPMTGT